MAASGRPLRSEDMAVHLGTNAVVVRRVLGPLHEAGILRSEKRHSRGWHPARGPASVTVAEVRRALGERPIPEGARRPPHHPGCAIEAALQGFVEAALAEAGSLLAQRLGR